MKQSGRIPIATVLCCAFLSQAAVAQAAQTVTASSAAFSTDRLSVATNLSTAVKIRSSGSGAPSPITHVNIYGPLGSTVRLEGSGTCSATELEDIGPEACPAGSRFGSGGGEALYELGGQLLREKLTLTPFIGDIAPGHETLLIYLSGSTPFPIGEVLTATVIQGVKPYGTGISVEVPLIKVLPESGFASLSSASLTLGASGQPSYYKTVHGKRTRAHVQGLVTPKSCPRGGWPVSWQPSFQDGSTAKAARRIACPRG